MVCNHIHMVMLTTVVIHRWTRLWAWWHCPDHRLVVWYHRLQEDSTQAYIMYCHSSIFQDKYYGVLRLRDIRRMAEYSRSTDRRPKPNATQAGSAASGLSLPSFRYRSGWYSIGLLKVSASCNMDLIKEIKTELRSESWSSTLTMNCQTRLFLVEYNNHHIRLRY